MGLILVIPVRLVYYGPCYSNVHAYAYIRYSPTGFAPPNTSNLVPNIYYNPVIRPLMVDSNTVTDCDWNIGEAHCS